MNAKIPLLLVLVVCGVGLFAVMGRRETPIQPQAVLPNVHRLNTRLLSGGSPAGEGGFARLQAEGVRTVISVDGAAPDAATAARYGLRTVHLPIGYDGIAPQRLLELAKAVRDLPGPIYLHCHHGKHRSPAAAVAATMCLDRTFTPDQAVAWMSKAGTDPHYRGLYALPQTLRRPTSAELNALPMPATERADVPDLAKRMVLIDETWERLKALRGNGWKAIHNRPDLDAAHEALQLVEHYREAARLPGTKTMPWAEAEREATILESVLRRDTEPEPAYQAAARRCIGCHAAQRDNR